MSRNDATETNTTRRNCVKYGGGLLTSALLAGCLGGRGPGANPQQESSTASPSPTPTEEPDPTPTETPSPYTAAIEPVGEVTFEEPPEAVVGGWGFVGDVLMALGQADTVVGMSRPGFWYQGFYDLLPDVAMRETGEIPATVSENYRLKEELLYELSPDLLATDPNRFVGWYQVEPATMQTIREDVAPFFGNESRSERSPGWPNWPDGEPYPYYGVSEFVERYAEVFREEERAEAMVDIYEATIEDVTSRVPPEAERPTVGLLSAFTNPENRGFFGVKKPIPALDATHELKQYGDLGVVDAFEGHYPDAGGHYDLQTGFEGLLDVDPDVLVFSEAVNALGGQNVYGSADAFEPTLEVLRTDEVGEQLTAVQNFRLYPGGTGSQGPIINLFQTEMLAKQLYPDEFGPWRGLGETPESERLFDRQRVADIINGDI